MAITIPEPGNSFIATVDWDGYLKLLDKLPPNRVRVNYDCGKVELVSPSPEHKRLQALLAYVLETVFLGFDIDFLNGGSTTFKSKLMDKGFEPDECYWLTHLDEVADVSTYDQETSPPPDLSIEVDMSESSISRMPIYAAFGVNEVWRYEQDEKIRLYSLKDGAYTEVEVSRFLPQVKPEELQRFVERGKELITSRLIREVAQWAREKRVR